IDRVGDGDDLPGRPASALAAQPRVVPAHAYHLIDRLDIDQVRVASRQLESVQPHDQARTTPLVPAVPDRVRPAPFADHDVRPAGEGRAGFGGVPAEAAPGIHP